MARYLWIWPIHSINGVFIIRAIRITRLKSGLGREGKALSNVASYLSGLYMIVIFVGTNWLVVSLERRWWYTSTGTCTVDDKNTISCELSTDFLSSQGSRCMVPSFASSCIQSVTDSDVGRICSASIFHMSVLIVSLCWTCLNFFRIFGNPSLNMYIQFLSCRSYISRKRPF